MAKTYKPEASIPVCCVTLATPLSGQQHIIMQTRYDVKGYYEVKKNNNLTKKEITELDKTGTKLVKEQLEKTQCEDLKWAIKNVTVSLLRDWGTSHAIVTLVVNLPSYDTEIPSLPRVDTFRGGNYPFLACEDEIRIYMGYVESPTTVITADMLDELPINVDKVYKHDPAKPLCPVFWGFIDKIDFDASSKGTGISYILSCRDRTRVFSDTKIISIPSLGGQLNNSGDGGNKTPSANPTGTPWGIVRDVAKATIGYIQSVAKEEQKICWKNIICPDPENKYEGGEAGLVEFYSAYNFDNKTRKPSPVTEDTLDPTSWLRRATHKYMDKLSRPRFHMWLQRPPLAKEGGSNQFQILDKSPLEIIRWIANLEERSTDFFASHINGDFIIGPRLLDTSGFYDPERGYRTYFFRTWPKTDLKGNKINPPCVNQLILNMRSFSSSIATFNRFVIVDSSQTSGVEASLLQEVTLSLDSIPWLFDGEGEKKRNPSVPCRTKLIYDANLANYENPSGGSLLTAIAASRDWGRDITGGQMTVIGDPTWYPSEAIRIYNTVLHDQCVKTDQGSLESYRSKELSYEDASIKYTKNNAPHLTNKENPADAIKANDLNNNVQKELINKGTHITDKDNLVLPVYKVRSIVHRMTTQGAAAGYLTDVVYNSGL